MRLFDSVFGVCGINYPAFHHRAAAAFQVDVLTLVLVFVAGATPPFTDTWINILIFWIPKLQT